MLSGEPTDRARLNKGRARLNKDKKYAWYRVAKLLGAIETIQQLSFAIEEGHKSTSSCDFSQSEDFRMNLDRLTMIRLAACVGLI
jgi:hypothetical protein